VQASHFFSSQALRGFFYLEKLCYLCNQNMATERSKAEKLALEVRRLTEQLVAAGRKDLLLHAIGVPLLEELRIEAARGKLSRLVIT
jgi:hypothetical protein